MKSKITAALLILLFVLTACLEDGATVPAGNADYDALLTAQAAEATSTAE